MRHVLRWQVKLAGRIREEQEPQSCHGHGVDQRASAGKPDRDPVTVVVRVMLSVDAGVVFIGITCPAMSVLYLRALNRVRGGFFGNR